MFRLLYLAGKRDVHGFLQIAAMLRRHAEQRDGADGSQAAEMIADYEQGHHHTLAKSNVVEIRAEDGARVVTPGENFDLWLHGEDFHLDERKANALEEIRPFGLYEFDYLHTALGLASIYCQFAAFPNSILRESSLLL
jgi:hypothetical protein